MKQLVDRCFTDGVEQGLWSAGATGRYTVEVPKHDNQGDFSTNIALIMAGLEKRNPRELATRFVAMLEEEKELIDGIAIAGPGFINITIKRSVWQQMVAAVEAAGENYGLSQVGGGRRVMVEFVSANPTGPLSVGHGRQAILGDAIARLLEATGHQVYREYYYNNAGRQMRVLGESVQARYLELLGRPASFPEDGYQGEYIYDIARELVSEVADGLVDSDTIEPFQRRAEAAIFKDIAATLARLGIVFDNYFNERSLYEDGLIDEVVAELRGKDLVYDQDGATWFRTSRFGQEKDRVIIKSSGEPTYRLPDIAYHREKFRRDFDWLIDIFGSDHIATVPDVLAGVTALGYDVSKVTVILHQFVTLMRDGKQVKMSTRKATFVTVDELLDEVGADAARFFFMMRKPDSQLEFDLDLAASQSQENPVYYVQYGHARLCSILRQAVEKGLTPPAAGAVDAALLVEDEEIELLKALAAFPALIEGAALELEPHRVIFYLMELAGRLHSYYNKHRVIGDDQALSQARLGLVLALRTVFRNGLRIIGLTAPETM
ncbi:arginine--tRNA ligase [Desulfofustis limnaeus]|uniref:arginine--tRNA ligase n=1 Tax=Desulfofustis limnaeus TaxID=2740163 RepID=UPI0024DFCF56|nr:arginine--tRNA ligase [Desulfofustis limnaeus]